MTLRTCERCGASLDPEERCDCEEHEAQNDECKVEEDGDGQLGFGRDGTMLNFERGVSNEKDGQA